MSQHRPAPGSEIILCQTEDGRTRHGVVLENSTVWLTQMQMAELFQTTKQNVSLYILNIFREGDSATPAISQLMAISGKPRQIS